MSETAIVKTMPPLAREIVRSVAVEHGVCVKPLPMRRVDLDTGKAEIKYIPCGNTLASIYPTCAERNRRIRAVQCRQGWHLEEEPRIERADPQERQELWVQLRAEAQAKRDEAARDGGDVELWDDVLSALDEELAETGARGRLKTGSRPGGGLYVGWAPVSPNAIRTRPAAEVRCSTQRTGRPMESSTTRASWNSALRSSPAPWGGPHGRERLCGPRFAGRSRWIRAR